MIWKIFFRIFDSNSCSTLRQCSNWTVSSFEKLCQSFISKRKIGHFSQLVPCQTSNVSQTRKLTNILCCRLGYHQCSSPGLPGYSVVVNLPASGEMRNFSDISRIFAFQIISHMLYIENYFRYFWLTSWTLSHSSPSGTWKHHQLELSVEIVPKNTICYSCQKHFFHFLSPLSTNGGTFSLWSMVFLH